MSNRTATLTPLIRDICVIAGRDARVVKNYLDGRETLASTARAIRGALLALGRSDLIPAIDAEPDRGQPTTEPSS
jgi:hypothetical protein